MISVSLSAVVILAALLFGAVYSWSMAIVAFVAVITFIYFLWSTKDNLIEFSNGKGIIFASLLLFSYPLFQLVPLPVPMLNMFHPKFGELITVHPNSSVAFHSISVYPFATEMEICRLFIYLTVFFVASFGIKDKEGAGKVVKALIVFGFILSIFAIIQHATWNGKIYWVKKSIHGHLPAFGPFVNRNHFAGFIGMIIPFSLGIAFVSRTIEKKVMYAFMGIAMAIALFFSLSRGGMISFIAGLLVYFFLVFTKGVSKRKLYPIIFFSLILSVYLLFLGISPVMERFAQSEVSTAQRFSAWQGTLSAVRDYAVFGSGVGTFQYIFKIYQPDGLHNYWSHAHNDYLEALLELGIVGIVAVVIFLFTALRIIIKTYWKGGELYLTAAFLSSLTTIAVHSVVDFNLHIPSNALLFFLILGLGVSLGRRAISDS